MISIIGGDGKTYGPVHEDQVRRWLAEGRATRDTQARREGDDKWQPLGEMAEFSNAGEPPRFEETLSAAVPQAQAEISEEDDREAGVLAGRLVRLVASLVDFFLSVVFMLPGLVLSAVNLLGSDNLADIDFQNLQPEQLGSGLPVILVGLFLLAGIQIWLLATRGQTVGKRLLSIRIVEIHSGEKPGILKVVVLRWFVPGLIGSISAFGLGLIFSLIDVCFIFRSDRRCVHDHMAGTVVIEGNPPDKER